MGMKLGELGDAIYAKTAEIAAANETVKQLELERRAMEEELLARMQEAGTDIVRGEAATVSISETIRPQIQDYDAFASFILRRKALHLLERRIASRAYSELKDSLGGKPIPGTTEFTQVRLNVRKVA